MKKRVRLKKSNTNRLLWRFIFYLLMSNYVFLTGCHNRPAVKIDRRALVCRHFPTLDDIDTLSPFSVGNGEFVFTADVTGLQTLSKVYEKDIPLTTQANWGWHRVPNFENFEIQQTWELVDTYGRRVPYAAHTNSDAAVYLRANPHKLHLGRIGFKNLRIQAQDFQVDDISDIDQTLDLWQGIIKSNFTVNGQSLSVETSAHPEKDQITVQIHAANLADAALAVGFDFPYASLEWGKNAADWQQPDKHLSTIIEHADTHVIIQRQVDSTFYYTHIHWQGAAEFKSLKPHSFVLEIQSKNDFAFTCYFSQKRQSLVKTDTCFAAAQKYWQQFWQSGGAVNLSQSTDPRARELERRIILSQYLTAIQCSGSLPPQETGLTANSWFGKFHLEMHWWHAVHFVLWGRPDMLEKSLPWYERILASARAKAELQGYAGVRWPKMAGPEGVSSPSGIGEFLIWQQPHPIYYAELLYRYYKNNAILQRYKNIVFETADFMVSYAQWCEKENRYVLGPPLIPAQEIYPPKQTFNAAFELSYWAFGLQTAQQWRKRLGMASDEKWQHVLDNLSQFPVNDGFYQNAENALDTFQNEFHRNDHPTVLGAFGMLPNDDIDIAMMQRTLEQVMESWNWQRTWGWDYPLVAMTAARVNRPAIAVDALLMDVPKNTFLKNGHNWQSDRLPLYLPGNGGLLTAIAMMAAGWDGAPNVHAPGFPQDGSWTVLYENLERFP